MQRRLDITTEVSAKGRGKQAHSPSLRTQPLTQKAAQKESGFVFSTGIIY